MRFVPSKAEQSLVTQQNLLSETSQLEVLKFLVTFTLTVAFRASSRTQIPYFVRMIKEALFKNMGLCLWLIETFSRQEIIKEFFIDNPISDMARFTAGLLKVAMKTLYAFEEESILKYIQMMDQFSDVSDFVAQTQKDALEQVSVKSELPQIGVNEPRVYSSCKQVKVIDLKSK